MSYRSFSVAFSIVNSSLGASGARLVPEFTSLVSHSINAGMVYRMICLGDLSGPSVTEELSVNVGSCGESWVSKIESASTPGIQNQCNDGVFSGLRPFVIRVLRPLGNSF
jgi:hypothetical protein